MVNRTEGVSSDELWSDLSGFSGKSNQERERYIAEHLFPQAGLTEVTKQTVHYGGSWGAEYGNWDGLSNVIATRKGSLASGRKKIILGAHFDKVTYPGRSGRAGRSDGILDNASGVTAIAKIAQALRNPYNDIDVVAFATEEPEPYFIGSRIYFGKLPDEGRVLFFANFDCLGRGNLALIRGAADPTLSELLAGAVASQGIPLAWRPADKEVVSDHVIAQFFGIRVLSFTSDSFDWRNTHVPEDNLSAVNQEDYYRQYLLSLRIIAYLDAYLADASPMP